MEDIEEHYDNQGTLQQKSQVELPYVEDTCTGIVGLVHVQLDGTASLSS